MKTKDFVNKFGDGRQKLSKVHKKERIKKVLGSEYTKLKMFNPNGMNQHDPHFDLSEIDFDKYPMDPHSINGDSRLLIINVEDNGAITMSGIVINGKEYHPKERGIWSVDYQSDEEQARFEINLFKKGEKINIVERTRKIHEDNGNLQNLEQSSLANTDDDLEKEY